METLKLLQRSKKLAKDPGTVILDYLDTSKSDVSDEVYNDTDKKCNTVLYKQGNRYLFTIKQCLSVINNINQHTLPNLIVEYKKNLNPEDYDKALPFINKMSQKTLALINDKEPMPPISCEFTLYGITENYFMYQKIMSKIRKNDIDDELKQDVITLKDRIKEKIGSNAPAFNDIEQKITSMLSVTLLNVIEQKINMKSENYVKVLKVLGELSPYVKKRLDVKELRYDKKKDRYYYYDKVFNNIKKIDEYPYFSIKIKLNYLRIPIEYFDIKFDKFILPANKFNHEYHNIPWSPELSMISLTTEIYSFYNMMFFDSISILKGVCDEVLHGSYINYLNVYEQAIIDYLIKRRGVSAFGRLLK